MPLTEEDKLFNLQIDLFESAKRELANFTKEPQQRRNIHVYKKHIENLDEIRESFIANHRKLIRSGLDDKHDYKAKDVHGLFDEVFITAYSTMQIAIDELPPVQSHSEGVHNLENLERLLERTLERSLHRNQDHENANPPPLECNLPKLTIPHFSGDQSLWPAFHDSFL